MATIGTSSGVVAVFAHAVYPLPSGSRTDALAAACGHLNRLFKVAGLIGAMEGAATEQARVAGLLSQGGEGSDWQLPVVRRVDMESPLEILTELGPAYLAVGLPGLLYLAKRVGNFHLEFRADAERLRAEAAHWEAERSAAELQALENYARIVQADLAIDPAPTLEIGMGE